MKFQYVGLFLDNMQRIRLLQYLTRFTLLEHLIYSRNSTLLCDHCTLMHVTQYDPEIEYEIGDTQVITVNSIGISEKAIAVGVDLHSYSKKCKNKIPHITICTLNGGKPVDSNDIKIWLPIENYDLTTTLKII